MAQTVGLRPKRPSVRGPRSRVLTPPWIAPTVPITRAAAVGRRSPRGGPRSRLILPKRGRFYLDGRGLYRVFNAAEYRFYRSNSAPPEESDSPFATNATLPHEPADTYADGTWYLSVTYFNGVIESGFLPLGPRGETFLRLDIASAAETTSPPAAPLDWRLEHRPSGVIAVIAVYVDPSADRAEEWAIAYTTDGSTPAADTPTETIAMGTGMLAVLDHELPAMAEGTVVKLRVQTRRNDGTWIYSEASSVETITARADGPAEPLGGDRVAGRMQEG